jgi:hypothetical protein
VPTKLRKQMHKGTFLGWAENTQEMYSLGIRNYTKFMLQYHMPCNCWLPMTTEVAQAWITLWLGQLSKSAMINYITGVHAWETINGLEPIAPQLALSALLCATNALAPVKKEQRLPVQIELLQKFHTACHSFLEAPEPL